jgi:hypothetical protein
MQAIESDDVRVEGCFDGACTTESRLKDGAQMNVVHGDETESSRLSATVALREMSVQ